MSKGIVLKEDSLFEDSNGNKVEVVKQRDGKFCLYDAIDKKYLHEDIPEYIFDDLESIVETYKSGGNPIEKILD